MKITGGGLQLEFDFEFDAVEIKKNDLPYFQNPKNDNEVLLQFQYDFLVKGDKNALDKIYRKSYEICLKHIANEIKKKRFFLSEQERIEKAHNASSTVVMRYLKKKGYCVKKNFVSVLYLQVQSELYHRTKAETIVDFIDFEEFNKFNDLEDENGF